MESEESYDMKNPLDDEDSEDQDSEDQDESKVKEEVAYENEENGTPSAASDTKKIAILVGIFIVGFALFFFAGKFFSTAEAPISLIDELHEMNELGKESPVNYVYNQYSFVSVEGLWYTKVENRLGGDFDVPVHFGPKDLENLPLQGSINRKFLENPIHITFDPLSDNMQYVALSAAELSTNLANGFQLPIIAACESNQSDACKGRPIVPTCTENKSVIFLRQANYTSVQMKDNCVVIQGRGLELVKATDRFLLQLYGIMA